MNIKVFKILISYKFKTFGKNLKIFIKNYLIKFTQNKEFRNRERLKKSGLIFLNKWGNKNILKKNNKRVLIDCMWNNPNFWFRYVLVRNALGLYKSKQYALFGEYSLKIEKLICNIFRFNSLGSLYHKSRPNILQLNEALEILKDVKSAKDFLEIDLPYSFPASVLYDGILKKQNKSTIDLRDENLSYYLAECLSYLYGANDLIDRYKFDIVLLSHCQEYSYASLAWLAAKKNIPVYVLYGEFGTCRFFYLSEPNDIFAYPSRPTKNEINNLTIEIKKDFINEGKELIKDRFDGKSNDPGSLLAFVKRNESITKNQICKKYNWDNNKPLIGVYCSNWFDYPHGSGLKSYTDFKDWIDSVLMVAKDNNSVNWLFKSHPCDDIYPSLKGLTISDLINKFNLQHIKIASQKWTGKDLINSLDGITTCHGTIGFEATILKKPVLVPYSGWYADLGFVQNALNKNNYIKLLNSKWYFKTPTKEQINLCAIASAIYFGKPKWQKFNFDDDIEQDEIYINLIENVKRFNNDLKKEITVLKDWFKSETKYYQVFKKINYK